MGIRCCRYGSAPILPRVGVLGPRFGTHEPSEVATNDRTRSPYLLVAKGQHDKARHNITKTHAPGYDVDGHMAEIHDSLARQNAENESQGSLAECFSKKHIKRTLVATSMFFIQNASGNAWVIGYMSYFMQLGGMAVSTSFDMTVGMSGIMVVGNMFGWFLVEKLGRRNTAFYGAAVLTVALFIIGILATINTPGAIWGQVAFMAVWSFGKLTYVLSGSTHAH
jgi:hypothetical protein